MAELTPFLPPFFPPPEISSFWETSIAITPSRIQEVVLTHLGRKYSTGSILMTSSLSMTLTRSPFYIAPLAVAPLLTSPLLPPLLPFLAPGRCFGTWVLTTYQFFYLSFSLWSFALSISSAAAFITSLTLNVAKSSIPFGHIKRPPQAWWSAEVEGTVNERRKAFAATHRSDKDLCFQTCFVCHR